MGGAGIFTRLFSIFLAMIIITAPLSSAVSTGYGRDEEKTGDNDRNAGDVNVTIPVDNSTEDRVGDNFAAASTENNTKYAEKNKNKEEDEENSRQKLKNRLESLQPDPSSPLALKQQAYGNILSIVPSGNEENKDITRKLDKARLHIEESIAGTLWYDGTRLKPVMEQDDDDDRTEIEEDDDDSIERDEDEPGYDAKTSVFRAEKTAAQNIMEVISKNKENATYDDILIEAIVNLVQADRNIAGTAIADAQRAASLYGASEDNHRDIEKAQKEFDKAVEKVQKGEPIDAIEHFENAWEHATSGLFMLDAAESPVIIFDSINSRYVNRTTINLSGHVEDAAVYTLSNITLEVNGIRSTLNLTGGVFKTDIGLNEGINRINATVTDNFGNTGANNITLIVDTIPPIISYSGAEGGSYYNTPVSVTANMTDENPDTLVILVNGNPYTQDAPIIIEGDYRVDIIARDLAGNTAGSSFTFHIDMTPPAIHIIKPVNSSFISGTAEVNFTVSDASPVNTEVTADGFNPLTGIFDSTAYPDGIHYIAVSAVDAAGNAARETVSFIVDNTPPDVSILEPANNEAIKGLREIIARVYDLYLKGVTIFINNKPVSDSVNHTFDTLNYPDGSYNISAEGVDLANNTGYGSISVIVDNTPPEVNVTSPANGSFVKQQVTVNANITEANPATTDVRIDGASASGALPYLLDTMSYPDGLHAIEVYARDRAGNEGSGNVLITVDNTLPQVNITSPVNGSFARGTVNITAEAYDANIANVSLAINGVQVSNTSTHAWNTTGYTDGWYRINAVVSDKSMNTAQKEVWVQVDNTAPLLIINEITENPTLGDPEYLLFIQTGHDANVMVNGEPLNLINGSVIYSRNITEGSNAFEIIATDALGNTAIWNITRLVDSDSLPDYYEINVSGTDPLGGDSDSSKTPSNEARNGILDDMEDFDGDLLTTGIEMKIGTNPFSDDTDGDELVDLFEIYFTGTNPITLDTDGDGIKDGNEDMDNDKLINIKEQYYGTDPDNVDTDADNLYDGKEINLGTDPLDSDSDDDGLPDGMEVNTGSNPLLKDSDGDGIPDGKETIVQEIERGELNLTITGQSEIYNTLRVSNISGYEAFSEMPGNIGKVFEIRTNSSFESATIKIPYNESVIADISENDLRIFTVNETTHMVDFLPTIVNTENNYVQAATDHFSIYGVAGYTKWSTTWNSGSNPTTPEFKMGDRINIKTMVHNTGDAPVGSNFDVYFYEGDPDAGGTYIGSTTVTGGISQGGAKTAVLYGYNIKSSSVDIYAKVDPQNSITEKSESNNKAYKTLSIGPQNFDSDGDGLTDWDEANGMRTYLGIFKTDPHDDDTDDDNLPDGLEMGMRLMGSYMLYSNPKVNDSDNDGLNDFEEYSLNTEPLFDKDSDNDGLWDGEEVHVIGTSPASKDTDGDGILDGTEYLYSIGYTPMDNKAFLNGDTNNLLPAGQEAPVTVEDINMDMQPALEMAYGIGFEGVKIFCLGDFAEGKITLSGAVDTTLCGVDIGLLIFPGDGPAGEVAITSVKTARFISGVKTWFKFQRLPNALNRLKKASYVKLGLKYVLKGETKPASIELRKAGIDEAEKLGILWQQGIFKETLNGFGNLLRHYADDAAKVAFKIRQLAGKGVDVKDMERVYENGGDLKKTINLAEKTEDGGSVIRWLEDGKLGSSSNSKEWIYDFGGSGWEHIRHNHVINPTGNQFLRYGEKYADEAEIQNLIMQSTKNGEKIIKDGDMWYIYEVPNSGGKKLSTLVGSNGYVVSIRPDSII